MMELRSHRDRIIKTVCCLTIVSVLWGTQSVCWGEVLAKPDGKLPASIHAIFQKKCADCHTGDESEAHLDLSTPLTVMIGGETGSSVVPGSPEKSLLWKKIATKEMPPEDEAQLTTEEKKEIRQWIQTGQFPSKKTVKQSHLKHLRLEAKKHWAFRSVVPPSTPVLTNKKWARTSFDVFVLAKMEAVGLSPVKDATPEQLLRRVHLDLTGLPPTPENVLLFRKEYKKNSSRALEKVVDQLLAPPEFGERWGRHWLDVARYADTLGGGSNFTLNNAWRYRDYVIQSFNEDKPYNQFVLEQIAGDLLPHKNVQQRASQLAATGFLALGSKDLSDQDKIKLVADVVDEQLDALGKTFMGLSLGCARCHGHKFDPVPMEDYYALAGILHSTRTLEKQEDDVKFSNGPSWVRYAHPVLSSKEIKEKSAAAKKNSGKLWLKTKHSREKFDELSKEQKRLMQIKSQSTKNSTEYIDANELLKKVNQQLQVARKVFQKNEQVSNKAGRLFRLFGARYPEIIALRDAEKPLDIKINVAGNPREFGAVVQRGVIRAFDTPVQPIPKSDSGRLQLAHWITHQAHPLTARVMVNRVWKHLMGKGIVESVDNFGTQGNKPTHQELLDHLASEFVKQGWSTKKLIRKIILSRTYQQASVHNEKNESIDPGNVNYWRFNPRRLDAEAIRDSLLFASGRLNRERGGSTLEYIGEFGNGGVYPVKQKALWRKRSVYLPVYRSVLFKESAMFPTFDFPSANIVCGRRSSSIVPTQSLFLMNNQLSLDAASALSEQLINMKIRKKVNRSYLAIFGRDATPQEIQRAENFLLSVKQLEPSLSDQHVFSKFVQVLFSGSEFLILN